MAEQQKPLRITEALITEALGANRFSVSGNVKRQLAAELDKRLNPPAWKVLSETGRSTPIINFRDTGIALHVYTQIPGRTVGPDTDRRLHIAELVAECLNARGLEVQ